MVQSIIFIRVFSLIIITVIFCLSTAIAIAQLHLSFFRCAKASGEIQYLTVVFSTYAKGPEKTGSDFQRINEKAIN